MDRFRLAMAIAILAGVPAVGPAAAQDAKKVKTAEFTGDLGFVNTAGNSEVTSLNIGDKLVVQSQDKRHVLTQLFGFVYGRSEGETIANNWRASARYEYGVGKRLYLYAMVGAERNRFAGIERRFEEGPGVVYKLLVAPRDNLDVEGGISAVQQRSTSGATDNFAAGRLAAIYKHSFTSKAFFSQVVEFLPNLQDGEDYRINTETAFVAPISANFGLKTAYVIRFDNTPLVTPTRTYKKTDRIFTTGIQVTY